MPTNVEIKARLADAEATRRLVAAAADGPPEPLEQTDTFFRVPNGRLKLREETGRPAVLLYYERPDSAGPRSSRYEKVDVPDADALREALAEALGVRGVVRKARLLYLVGRTRVHLDAVAGLGDFLELEVVLAEGDDPRDGAEEAEALLRRFAVPDAARVGVAYVDLLERPKEGA